MASQGWNDLNEQRRFPFADDADMGDLADGVFSGMQLTIPDSVSGVPYLSSISIGPSYISFVMSVSGTDVAWFGGDKQAGIVLGMTSLIDGVSGLFMLGQDVNAALGRYDLGSDAKLAEGTYSYVQSPSVNHLQIVFPFGTSSLDGIIELRSGSGIDIETRSDVTITGVGVVEQAIEISLSESLSNEQWLRFAGNCARHTQGGNCVPAAISFINGVRPACDGTITLRFVGDVSVVDAGPGVMSLDTDLVIDRACSGDDIELYDPPADLPEGSV